MSSSAAPELHPTAHPVERRDEPFLQRAGWELLELDHELPSRRVAPAEEQRLDLADAYLLRDRSGVNVFELADALVEERHTRVGVAELRPGPTEIRAGDAGTHQVPRGAQDAVCRGERRAGVGRPALQEQHLTRVVRGGRLPDDVTLALVLAPRPFEVVKRVPERLPEDERTRLFSSSARPEGSSSCS
jgi:hypothetical protein